MSTILEALKRSQAMRDAASGSESQARSGRLAYASAQQPSTLRLVLIGLVAMSLLVLAGWLFLSRPDSQQRVVDQEPVQSRANNTARTEQTLTSEQRPAAPSDVDRQAEPSSAFEPEPDAGQRIREITSRSPEHSEPNENQTQWDTGPGPSRDEAPRQQQEQPGTEVAQEPPSRQHRLPENTVNWPDFVRNYPRRPPELSLTAHRYHSAPERRLAMINMRRYKPGDRINHEVVLREIVPTGVVVIIGDQNVLLEATR